MFYFNEIISVSRVFEEVQLLIKKSLGIHAYKKENIFSGFKI